MNQSQMLLILGALVMFSFLSLNAHRTMLTASQMRLDSEYIITAAEVAETVLNEVKSKAFDEKTVSGTITNEDELSQVLGPESGETTAVYDDVDDYKTDGIINSATTVTTPRVGQYAVTVSVDYVSPNAPTYVCSNPTRMKRIRILVSSSKLKVPLRLDYFASY